MSLNTKSKGKKCGLHGYSTTKHNFTPDQQISQKTGAKALLNAPND